MSFATMSAGSLEAFFKDNIDGQLFLRQDGAIIGLSDANIGLQYLSEQSECTDAINALIIDILSNAPTYVLEQSDFYDLFNIDGRINWNIVVSNLYQDEILSQFVKEQITIDDLEEICNNSNITVYSNKKDAMDEWVNEAISGYELNLIEY